MMAPSTTNLTMRRRKKMIFSMPVFHFLLKVLMVLMVLMVEHMVVIQISDTQPLEH